jgi:hypothetical protein
MRAAPWNKARVRAGGSECSYVMVAYDDGDKGHSFFFDHCYYDERQLLPVEDMGSFENVVFLPTSCYVLWVGERVYD